MTGFRYYEDFSAGETIVLGSRRVTREEIIAFAAAFDPQPFHLDEEAAAKSMLGGLAASGWHTAAIFMRLLCEGLLLNAASRGSPGVETLEWKRPVRPGDVLTATATVLDSRPSRSRPEIGFVRFRFEVTNQAGETVMTMANAIMFGRRAAEAGGASA